MVKAILSLKSIRCLKASEELFLIPAGNYMLKVNNRSTRERCEIYSKLTKTPERRHWRHSSVLIVNFEHISHLPLCFYC